MNNINENKEDNIDEMKDEAEFHQSAHLIAIQGRKNNGNPYLSAIKSLFLKKKEKKQITPLKIYKKEDKIFIEQSKNDLSVNTNY